MFSATLNASVVDHAEALLNQMNQASQTLDYELNYIFVYKNQIDSLRYRHGIVNDQDVAHVAYLSGPVREVIHRDNEVSYFEYPFEPFTIESDQIVAPLPVIPVDTQQLSKLYDFVSLGRSREAGLVCDVVRISSKDDMRYSYLLWIDQKSKLLVRADLLDQDDEPIEQVRALSLVVSPAIGQQLSGITNAKLPPMVSVPQRTNMTFKWDVEFIPEGFHVIAHNSYPLLSTQRAVENQMFSDGLFNFSVYVAKADQYSVSEQMVRQGRRALYTLVKANAEITVLGDIPLNTAKRIANSVTFKLPLNNQPALRSSDVNNEQTLLQNGIEGNADGLPMMKLPKL